MYNEYYTLRGLVLAEDKILTDGDKKRLLKYLDVIKEDELILTHNQSDIQIGSFSKDKLQELVDYFEKINSERVHGYSPLLFANSSYLEYLKSKEEI